MAEQVAAKIGVDVCMGLLGRAWGCRSCEICMGAYGLRNNRLNAGVAYTAKMTCVREPTRENLTMHGGSGSTRHARVSFWLIPGLVSVGGPWPWLPRANERVSWLVSAR